MKVNVSAEDVIVYRTDGTSQAGKPYTRYSTKISQKKDDGTWLDQFINLRFKGGADIPHKAKITINRAFPTLDEYKGEVTRNWVVMDWNLAAGQNTTPSPQDDGFMNIPDGIDEELPFS